MKTILNKRFVSLLAAGGTLAMAALVGASSSTQVKELNPLVVPRTAHAATALTDGRILITGGRDSAGNIVAVSEIFDPATETSTAGATLTTPRVDHTATLLPDGKVLVAGGTGASGSLTSAEIFDPSNPAAGFRVLSATMGAARARHTATLLNNGKVLIAGGDDAGTAEIFDPATESFSSALLAMAAPRIGHSATLFSDDSVLLAGGNTDSMELFTPADQKFTLDPKKMSAARTGHEAIELSNTRLLFFEGDAGNTIDEFNPSADTLSLKDTMDGAASSATLLANGKILVLGPDAAGLYSPDAADPSSAFTAFDETSVPGSTALKRSGQTATELSGDKRILVAGGVNAQDLSVNPALFNAARIWTDKDDYVPDEPVVLSGSGWKPNESVYLYAVDTQTEAWTYGSTVPADANGGFVVNPYFIVQLAQLGVNFSVTAVGAQSAMQADVKFTDAAKPTSAITFPTDGGSYNTAGWTAGASSKITGTGSFASGSTLRKVEVSIKRSSTGLYWNGSAFSNAVEAFQLATGTTSWSLSFPSANFPADGTYVVHSLATDNNGQENGAGGVATFTFDNAGPAAPSTPTLHPGDNSGSNADTITNVNTPHFDGTAEANSTVKILSDGVQVGSGPAGNNGSYSVQTSVLSDNNGSPHTITATATDAAGNQSVPSASSSVTIDTVRPTVTIDQAAAQSDPTNTSPINFTVVFSESVADFATGDVTVSGTAGGPKTATVTGSGTTYNVAVSGMTTSGTVIATIGQNAANDTAANGSTASTSTDNSVQFNSNVATTLVLNSVNPNSVTYGSAGPVTFTATLTRTTGGAAVSGATVNFTVDGGAAGSGVTNSSGVATFTTYNPSALSVASHNVLASFTAATISSVSYLGSTSGTLPLAVTKATPTINWSNPGDIPYGTALSSTQLNATATLGVNSVPGTFTYTPAAGTVLAFGANQNLHVDFVPTDTSAYSNASKDVKIDVNKAHLRVAADDQSRAYGAPNPTFTATITGFVNGDTVAVVSGSPTFSGTGPSSTATTAAGDYVITPAQGTLTATNYDFTPFVDGTLHITKIDATIVVTGYSGPYTATAHGATGTATGLSGADLNSLLHVATTTYTDVPGGLVHWTFDGNTNYNSAFGDATVTITKVDATIDVTGYSGPYTATAHGATGTATGLSGADLNSLLHVATTTYTDVPGGLVHWTFDGNTNYNSALGDATVTITKADAVVTVSGYSGFYDGMPHGSSGSVMGVDAGGAALGTTLNLGAPFTNYPGGIAYWTFSGGTNYNNQNGSVLIVINKVHLTVTADNKSKTYNGSPFSPFTVTLSGFVNAETSSVVTGTPGFTGSAVGAFDAGTYTITPTLGTLSAVNYDFTVFVNGTLTFNKAHLTVTADNKSVQYSDPLPTFTATITGFVGTDTVAVVSGTPAFSTSATITFYSGTGGVSNAPGAYTNAIIPSVGSLMAANYDFPAANFVKGTLTVTQEDARAYYTGSIFLNTSGPSSTTAVVTLSATIKDITPVGNTDPAYDTYPGIITNAKVTFINRDNNTVIASNVPVGLVNAGDSTVGTATYNWSVNITPPSQTYTIGIIVTNYYTDNSSSENTVVTVAQPPAAGSITGGGYLVMSSSAGLYPGGVGTKNNFGFNCQNTKSGVKGNINTIIRNNGRVYQIKGNSMTSLTTNPITSTTGTATFNGKANIQDITNPNAPPISIDGNATLQVSMADNGEPGSNDTISITVFNKSGGVWFTSNWNGTTYVQQKIGGGNLQVR